MSNKKIDLSPLYATPESGPVPRSGLFPTIEGQTDCKKRFDFSEIGGICINPNGEKVTDEHAVIQSSRNANLDKISGREALNLLKALQQMIRAEKKS